MRRLYTFIAIAFFVFMPATPRSISKYDELALRLHNLAQRCVTRAKEMPPQIAGADDLFLTARICAQGAEDLFSRSTQDKEAVIRHVVALLDGTQHTEKFIRRSVPTDTEREEDVCIHLPLNEIITMIEEEKLDLYLRPTPLQLTAKRMIFKLIVELFHGLGRRLLDTEGKTQSPEWLNKKINDLRDGTDTANANDDDDAKPTSTDIKATEKAWRRFMGQLKESFLQKRPHFYLRTLRILANKFVDKSIPHPDQPEWHKPLEMLIPLAIGHLISFLVAYEKKKWSNVFYEIGQDALIRAAYSRFYCKEGTTTYKIVNVLCWILPFILEDTSRKLWRKANKDTTGTVRPLWERCKVWGNAAQDDAATIFIEGAVTIAIWNTIDDYLMPLVEIPQWLLATPVQHSKRELLNNDSLEELLEESRDAATTEK